MISDNVWVWVKLGYLYPSDSRYFIFILPQLLFSCAMISNCILSEKDIETKTLDAYYTALELNCTVNISV